MDEEITKQEERKALLVQEWSEVYRGRSGKDGGEEEQIEGELRW